MTIQAKQSQIGRYPYSVTNMGDQDGDGVVDLVVGSPYSNSINPSGDGTAFLISGRSTKTFATIHGRYVPGWFGHCAQNLGAPHAVFYNNLSLLDTNGEGKVGFTLPMGPPRSLAGTTLQHSCPFIGKARLRFANLAVPLKIKLF